ncbi:MAG TPA: hypothetical protein VJT73_12235 [Polyangiaceae bacterium]|nr:hypothetical protein [Polyangiaceae bacterium]
MNEAMNKVLGASALFTTVVSCSKHRPPQDEMATAAASVAPPSPHLVEEVDASTVAVDDASPAAAWTVEPADGGTLLIKYRGAEVASFKYLFWGADFAWADAAVKNVRSKNGETTFEIDVDALGLAIAGKMAKSGPGEIAAEFGVIARKSFDGVVGGGLEFALKLDAKAPTRGHDPYLTSGQRGFRWDLASGDVLEVSFDPPLPALFFEQNQKSVVRCFLVGKTIRPGAHNVVMKVRLPRSGAVRRSVDERYGDGDRSSWYPQTLDWDTWPVDVSFLNEKPAGRRGRVKAEGDRLVFEDGTPVRFWGANVQAYALYHGSKDDVARQAKRIAALGYNLVRIHHHDSDWVSPNVFDRSGGTTQKLDARALDSIDWWVKCLKDEGVYVWLDLHVGRQFLPGDGIDGFAELAKQKGSGKGFNYVNPRIEKLMQTFAADYVTRTNPYTKTAYIDEPAVMGVLLTNENDLSHHFAPQMAPDKGNPVHAKLFAARVKEFAGRAGLPLAGSLASWEPGPGKIVLAELEHAYDQRATSKLRGAGVKSLVATTSFWGEEALYSLPSLASGDIVDVHSYGKAESLGKNPRYEANFVAWIAAAHVAGKPLSITEWNVEYPSRDRFVAPLYMAAVSALQGWDAPMIYGYAQTSIERPEKPDTWSSWNDPALTALMPAAALMFRQAHVHEARKTYRLDLTRENLYYASTSPDTSVAIRTAVEQSRLVIGLPDIPELSWDAGLSFRDGGATPFRDLGRDFIPAGQDFVVSDTGEIKRDWSLGVETIDTPLSQAAMGWIGGRSCSLHDVTFDVKTPKATVALTSLDGKPLATSKKMLLTVVGQVAASGDSLPFLAEPIEGALAVRSSQPLRMVPLSPRANPPSGTAGALAPIFPVLRGQEQVFTLARGVPTHWFLLEPAPSRVSK